MAHLSQWISLPDLVKQVTQKCPPNTDIPSKSLVRLQFQPRNKNSRTAATYTKKYAVQYKIQVQFNVICMHSTELLGSHCSVVFFISFHTHLNSFFVLCL